MATTTTSTTTGDLQACKNCGQFSALAMAAPGLCGACSGASVAEDAKPAVPCSKCGALVAVWAGAEEVLCLSCAFTAAVAAAPKPACLCCYSKSYPIKSDGRCTACQSCPPVETTSELEAGVMPSRGKTAKILAGPPATTPTTQKARGILALEAAGWWQRFTNDVPLLWLPAAWGRPGEAAQFGKVAASLVAPGTTGLLWATRRPAFARPCPPRPVHGFIDSRVVTTVAQVLELLREIDAVEPAGELLLMPQIEAKGSGILTPGLLVLGPGHDGATGGKRAVSLPLAPTFYYPKKLREASGLGPDDAPYFEFILGKPRETPQVVQLRAGPPLVATGGSGSYIPAPVRVRTVRRLKDGEDLMNWAMETARIKYAKEPGWVVHHPGGSVASHYGVHCALNGIAYVTEAAAPVVGRMLRPTVVTPAGEAVSLPAVLQGMRAVHPRHPFRGYPNDDPLVWPFLSAAYNLPLFVLHNALALLRSEEGCYVVGAGLVVGAKLALMALMGESRHANWTYLSPKSREWVYKECWPYPAIGATRLAHLYALYCGESWAAKVGGFKWARCAMATRPLVNGVVMLARRPSHQAVREAVSGLNAVVNAGHNCGPFLSKFLSRSAFGQAASNSAFFLMREVAPAVWLLLEHRREVPLGGLGRAKIPVEPWRRMRVGPPFHSMSATRARARAEAAYRQWYTEPFRKSPVETPTWKGLQEPPWPVGGKRPRGDGEEDEEWPVWPV